MNDLPLRAGKRIDRESFDILRRRMCLHHAKWDPQVGDVATLADFPLLLTASAGLQLSTWAEALAEELLSAERELLARPALLKQLGLPWRMRRALGSTLPDYAECGRVVRFDFHLTPQGWQLSEANADVPGGFAESSAFTTRMAEHFPNTKIAADPAAAWADFIRDVAGNGPGVVALCSVPGFMEDTQVLAALQPLLIDRQLQPMLCRPANISWSTDGVATLWNQPVSTIVRFVQSEWLTSTTRQWRYWREGKTPVLNPLSAIIVESKRFPLAWNQLSTQLPTWRSLLPTTADPRAVSWQADDWLVKPAFGNTGDDVASSAFTPALEWHRTVREVRRRPRDWVAQQRFEITPIDTPTGPRRPCVGVYTIAGRAAGLYGRLSVGPVVDFAAVDCAILIEP